MSHQRDVRRGLAIAALVFAGTVGCNVTRHSDPLAELPTTIGGEAMRYGFAHGPDAPEWAQVILAATGKPASALTAATTFAASPGAHEFQTYVVRIEGVDGQTLIDPGIRSFGFQIGQVWTETIAGKTVTRYTLEGEADPASSELYAYAFDDVLVMMLSRRRNELVEALQQMP